MPQRIDCAVLGDSVVRRAEHHHATATTSGSTASCTIAFCASVPCGHHRQQASKPWRWWKLSSRQMRTIARAYGAYEQRQIGTWFMIAAPSTSQPIAPMSAQVSVG